MSILVASPSTAVFAQQAALAFHERAALAAFLTAFAYREDGALGRLVAAMPSSISTRLEPQLRRREVSCLPAELVEVRPFWELVRTVADRAGAGENVVDQIWDRFSRTFTTAAAKRAGRGVSAVYAYEYTALEAFAAAKTRGAARILDLPSLDSRQFEALQRREKEQYPELRGPHEEYFAERFERRQARRDAEVASADVLITNSRVTRESHIVAGADPAKTFAVNYGAPPPVAAIAPRRPDGPLRVVWAGTFSIRKGAHYFVQAWRRFGLSSDAQADIYGANALPARLYEPAPKGMVFHGSVPRDVLFAAFDAADVLIFPTLSDGFGMVVTEAFARGLPVITTDRAGASDLVRHETNGLIIPAGDAGAIGNALSWCLNNRDQLAGMRGPARDTAASWQWSDYRRALADAVTTGLVHAGHAPPFAASRMHSAA